MIIRRDFDSDDYYYYFGGYDHNDDEGVSDYPILLGLFLLLICPCSFSMANLVHQKIQRLYGSGVSKSSSVFLVLLPIFFHN